MDRTLKCSQDTTVNWSALYGAVGAERVKQFFFKFKCNYQLTAISIVSDGMYVILITH